MKATVPANDRELVKLLRLSLVVTKPRDSAANADRARSHQEKTKTRKTSVAEEEMSDEEVEALEQARKDAETDTLWLAAHLEICKGCDRCQIGSFFGAESYSVNDVYASERGTK